MKNEKILYLIVSVLFALLAVGYTVVIAIDFLFDDTPGYLTALHILATIVFYTAAIVNFGRYRKH